MKADVEKLIAARELIARPGGWTQGCAARNVKGRWVDAIDSGSGAACFCAIGAIWATFGSFSSGEVYAAEAILQTALADDVVDWNDKPGRTQPEVVSLFDRAIELARAS